jgi:hypothetical protein
MFASTGESVGDAVVSFDRHPTPWLRHLRGGKDLGRPARERSSKTARPSSKKRFRHSADRLARDAEPLGDPRSTHAARQAGSPWPEPRPATRRSRQQPRRASSRSGPALNAIRYGAVKINHLSQGRRPLRR